MKSAVFIERDGFLVKRIQIRGRERPPQRLVEMQLCEAILPFLQAFARAGLVIIGTTNQPAIARGEILRKELEAMHAQLMNQLPIDQLLFCPHDEEDDCACRKPRTGQFLEAAFQHRLDLNHSYMLSDQWQDATAAQALGITSIMIESKRNGNGHRDFVLPTIEAATAKILHLHTHPSELFIH